MNHQLVIAEVQAWLQHVVIGLNLCPFAKAVVARQQVRYVVSEARDGAALREALEAELAWLAAADPALTDTSLLIHPQVLQDFDEYNHFLDDADAAVRALGLEGTIQVASFHPLYRFAGTQAGDVSNATNRSPYPLLHLLREASVDRAVAAFPNPESIYEANIQTLQALGAAGWLALQARCRREAAG
jgi:hypothetical protein